MFFLEAAAFAFLLACSAFFSGSETALTTLSVLKLKQLAVIRPDFARLLGEWLNRPHRLLTTILIGNNAVNIALSSLAATLAVPFVSRLPGGVGMAAVWIATTVLLLVFGEIAPKIVARTYAERVSVLALPLLGRLSRVFSFFLSPVHAWLEKHAGRLAAPPVNRITQVSLEELRVIVDESKAAGHVHDESGDMMKRALAMAHRRAADIMRPAADMDMVALEAYEERGAEFFVDLLVETGRSRVPVTRAGTPIGYIRVMDVLAEGRAGRRTEPDALVRPPVWAPADKPVAELLESFRTSGEHIVFVEGALAEFLGAVTLEDVLEEIVGEILDEYDVGGEKE